MLVPKLFLSGIAGITGVSCLAPLSIAMGKGEDPTIWRVSSRHTFPLLTCQSKKHKSKVWISLEFKKETSSSTENKEIVFAGQGNTIQNKKEKINLYDIEAGKEGTFQLMIWDTGKNVFGELGGEDSHKFGDDLVCQTKAFKVKDSNKTFTGKGFTKIKLSLEKENCQDKVCTIKIDDDAGLEWSDEFKPKVII